MQPFQVTWRDADFSPIRDKIRAYRSPAAPTDSGWQYGCDPHFLDGLRQHWADQLDVAAVAAELNRFPQFTTRIDDIDLHAVHVLGEAEGRRPLLLTHGWPGSIYEFWQVIEPLAFPSRHGGNAADAFDLVIPSLPGYGFSSKPRRLLGARTTAGLFRKLMQAFGYERFLAQGGDWGAGVSTWLALDHADAVPAIHLNYLLVHPAPDGTPAFEQWRSQREGIRQRFSAYAMLQVSKPQSLAYATVDNPVAQAAWIVERFHDWSDLRERPFEQVFSLDQLLTNIMVYVMNDAFTSSIWYYAAAEAEKVRSIPEGRRVEVPTAVSFYHDTLFPTPPRPWVETGYAVSRWIEQPRGGHFAAMEVPDLFVADLRAWGHDLPRLS